MRRLHRVKQVRDRVERREEAAPARVDYDHLEFNELRQVAKDAGINTFSMGRDEIVAALQGVPSDQ